jgi:DNA-binding GntR family transcriptional regulator
MVDFGLNIPRAISLRQQVTDSLRDSILSGTLKPGQKLIERELCEAMQISRTVLREALQHLEAEGMIVNAPPKGRAVAAISQDDAKEIYGIRRAMERMIAESLSGTATRAQIAELRQKLERLNSVAAFQNAVEAEDEFIATMLKASHNRIAAEILSQINNRVMILRRRPAGNLTDIGSRRAELHALMSAIDAGSPKAAGRMRVQKAG